MSLEMLKEFMHFYSNLSSEGSSLGWLYLFVSLPKVTLKTIVAEPIIDLVVEMLREVMAEAKAFYPT